MAEKCAVFGLQYTGAVPLSCSINLLKNWSGDNVDCGLLKEINDIYIVSSSPATVWYFFFNKCKEEIKNKNIFEIDTISLGVYNEETAERIVEQLKKMDIPTDASWMPGSGKRILVGVEPIKIRKLGVQPIEVKTNEKIKVIATSRHGSSRHGSGNKIFDIEKANEDAERFFEIVDIEEIDIGNLDETVEKAKRQGIQGILTPGIPLHLAYLLYQRGFDIYIPLVVFYKSPPQDIEEDRIKRLKFGYLVYMGMYKWNLSGVRYEREINVEKLKTLQRQLLLRLGLQ